MLEMAPELSITEHQVQRFLYNTVNPFQKLLFSRKMRSGKRAIGVGEAGREAGDDGAVRCSGKKEK